MIRLFSPRSALIAATCMAVMPVVQADMALLDDGELRSVTAGSALQYSATDINYELRQLTGIEYERARCSGLLGCVVGGLVNGVLVLVGADGNRYHRTEQYTVTEEVNATVHRVQINGTGELHAYADKFTFGDYGGSNNSIYKGTDGQGLPENALENFGFGNGADDPFVFEDPYIEIQRQHHSDGSETIRGIRIGFGKANGHTPLTINSASGYISTLSLMPDLGGIVKAQVYGTGTKDTFVSLLGDIPDGSGNYPQFGPSGAPRNTSSALNAGAGTLLDPLTNFLSPVLDVFDIDATLQKPGGKELNLEHVRSLDFHNVENFYISLTQGGGNSFVNDGSVNGALWSQHLGDNPVIPASRPDLPGWNMVMPFNDRSQPQAGFVEAHVDMIPALSQILLGVGDDNPRQSYRPVF